MRRFIYLSISICFFQVLSYCAYAQKISIIPWPASIHVNEGSFPVSVNTKIYTSKEAVSAAEELARCLWSTDFQCHVLKIKSEAVGVNSIVFKKTTGLPSEGYCLFVRKDRIVIEAQSPAGFFYAVQTIRQLLSSVVEKQVTTQVHLIPCLTIKDSPRFSWRGMMLDVSRHFLTIDEVKKFIDYMAFYKMNTLHLHLTDDQGWRIEIKKYPLLTEKGAWRIENKQDSDCHKRSKDDSMFVIPEKNYKILEGKRVYGGFYTQAQIRDLVHYATQRCIIVIPEIDMPGHFNAAMQLYPELSCGGEAGWGSLYSFPACPSKESTYTFMENILSEVADLFPSRYIHIGGDEVNVDSWKKCSLCQKAMKEKGFKKEQELQSDFNRRIEKFIHSKGKRILGWDEITDGGLSKESTVMWWRNWVPKAPYVAVKNGSDLIMSPDFQYYFNTNNTDVPLAKVYEYEPCPKDFTPEEEKYLLGVQANLWSEQIPNFTRVQYQTFPRLLALSETAWSPASKKSYTDFVSRLKVHYVHLSDMGICAFLPAAEGLRLKTVFVEKSVLSLKPLLPDMKIYYTLDGSVPTLNSTLYSGPISISKSCTVKTRIYWRNISSQVFMGKFEKQILLPALSGEGMVPGILRSFVKGTFDKAREVYSDSLEVAQIVPHVSIEGCPDVNDFGLTFDGFVKVNQDGVYDFSLTSDDGAVLYIDDLLVVDNDGSHEERKDRGMVALKAGFHSIVIKYHQFGNSAMLKAEVTDPNGRTHELSTGDLYYKRIFQTINKKSIK